MSYAPPGESLRDIRVEQSLLDGTVIGGAAYGVHLTIFIQCIDVLSQRPKDGVLNWRLIVYVCGVFSLGTVGFGAGMKYNEKTFIDDRNFPGGPLAFNYDMFGDPMNVLGFSAFFVLDWLAQSLLIHRLYMFWNNRRDIIIIPTLMLVGCVIVSVLLLIRIAAPHASFFQSLTFSLTTPYCVLTAGLDVTVTSLIIGRLFFLRRGVRDILTPKSARMYISVAALLIESAALYTTVGAILFVSYIKKSMVFNVMLPVLGQVQAISSLLIILRVARGTAWSQNLILSTTEIKFESPRTVQITNVQHPDSAWRSSIDSSARRRSVEIDIGVDGRLYGSTSKVFDFEKADQPDHRTEETA